MNTCTFTTKEVNLIKRALNDLNDKASAVKSYGFDVGNIKEEIYVILKKINQMQGAKNGQEKS